MGSECPDFVGGHKINESMFHPMILNVEEILLLISALKLLFDVLNT
jgi:hypothetical protein